MEISKIKEFWDAGEEEKRILEGLPQDPSIYFSDEALIKSEKMLGEAKYEVGIKTHPRYAAFPEHGHNFVEMMIAVSGEITHKIADKTVTLRTGDVLLMNKHVRHSIDRAEEGDLGVNIIITDSFFNSLAPEVPGAVFSGFLKDNADKNGNGAYLCFAAKKSRQAENLIENIILELTEKGHGAAILGRTLALLFCYLGQREDLLTEVNVASGTEDARREKILAYVKENYRTATLFELSRLLFLSEPYLSALISSYFGKSFSELLLLERLTRANILIRETAIPILEVIRSVGYENASYFHRQYKKHFGDTPLSRRRECKL